MAILIIYESDKEAIVTSISNEKRVLRELFPLGSERRKEDFRRRELQEPCYIHKKNDPAVSSNSSVSVTVECKVFDYDQLPTKTRERLLQDIWESVTECYRADHIEEPFKERLEAIGFMNPKFWWSINSGRPGDGACFDAEPDMAKICKHLGIEYDPKTLEDEWTCSINVLDHNSGHALSREIECDAGLEIQERIEELRRQLCTELYQQLLDDYETESGKENLLEMLRSHRYVQAGALQTAIAEASASEAINFV